MRRADKRDHLIDIAMRLFSRNGYRATGIDVVLAEAGIAKTTLYRHFESKEELIVAALVKADEMAREELRSFVEAAGIFGFDLVIARLPTFPSALGREPVA